LYKHTDSSTHPVVPPPHRLVGLDGNQLLCTLAGSGASGSVESGACDCNVARGQTAEASCTTCPAGKYRVEIGASCTACGAGKHSESGGPCLQCESGKFKSGPGTGACVTCDIGKYGVAGAVAESECMSCPSGKFGAREGASMCIDCEAGKVSNTGEVVCRSVTVAPLAAAAPYVVKLALLFPLATSEFTADKQSKVMESIAVAVGANPSDVTIDKIETMTGRRNFGRRLLSVSVLVYIAVKAADAKQADAMATSLTADKINKALENTGLPKATMKQSPTVTYVSTSPIVGGGGDNTSNQSTTNIHIIIGAVVGGAIVLCIISACYYFRCWQSKHPADNAEHTSCATGHGDAHMSITSARLSIASPRVSIENVNEDARMSIARARMSIANVNEDARMSIARARMSIASVDEGARMGIGSARVSIENPRMSVASVNEDALMGIGSARMSIVSVKVAV
jgi:hypothetical protein